MNNNIYPSMSPSATVFTQLSAWNAKSIQVASWHRDKFEANILLNIGANEVKWYPIPSQIYNFNYINNISGKHTDKA